MQIPCGRKHLENQQEPSDLNQSNDFDWFWSNATDYVAVRDCGCRSRHRLTYLYSSDSLLSLPYSYFRKFRLVRQHSFTKSCLNQQATAATRSVSLGILLYSRSRLIFYRLRKLLSFFLHELFQFKISMLSIG